MMCNNADSSNNVEKEEMQFVGPCACFQGYKVTPIS